MALYIFVVYNKVRKEVNQMLLVKASFISITIIVLIFAGVFFGVKTIWNLFSGGSDSVQYGEETLVQRGFIPLGHWGQRETNEKRNNKGLMVVDNEVVHIQDTDFFQKGDIIVRGEGKLIFQNSVVEITPEVDGEAKITILNNGELIFEKSTLKSHADDPSNLYISVLDNASFLFSDSKGVNKVIGKGNAQIRMDNSTWAYSMPDFKGGVVAVSESANIEIRDSIIGGLELNLPSSAQISIKDFRPKRFASFDLTREFASGDDLEFSILLENTEILDDYYNGAGSRGLILSAPFNIKGLDISKSQLGSIVIKNTEEDMQFVNLNLGVPMDFMHNNIRMKDSVVEEKWEFSLTGGNSEFANSNGLYFTISGSANLLVVNSEIIGFNPKDFSGVVDFQNSIWKNKGKIAQKSDFLLKGSWFSQDLDLDMLDWKDSRIIREFYLKSYLLDPSPVEARGASVEVYGKKNDLIAEFFTNQNGEGAFQVVFDDLNYKDTFYIKVAKFDQTSNYSVDFLTPSEIVLLLK